MLAAPLVRIYNIKSLKRIIYLLSVSVFVNLFCSCEIEEPMGKWDDNIKLSTSTAQIGAEADSVSITTEGTWWWINNVAVNGVYYYPTSAINEINPDSTGYSVKEACFVIGRPDFTTLFIKADANTTGAVRTIRVGLEAGNYFDSITITQAAE